MMSYKEGPTLRIDLSNMGTLEESDRTVLISVPIAVQRGNHTKPNHDKITVKIVHDEPETADGQKVRM